MTGRAEVIRGLAVTRLACGALMGTRHAAARFSNRHPDDVRRRCEPVACDVRTRAQLYDLDAVAAHFATLPTRRRRVA